jgi:hypothetical protein
MQIKHQLDGIYHPLKVYMKKTTLTTSNVDQDFTIAHGDSEKSYNHFGKLGSLL